MKKSSFLQRKSKLLLSACLLFLMLNDITRADNDNTADKIKQTLIQLKHDADEAHKTAIQNLEREKSDQEAIQILLKELEVNKISSEKAMKEIEELQFRLTKKEELRAEMELKFKELQENTEKQIFKSNAQKIVPFLYAIIALSLSSGEEDEKVVAALAGYGAGSLIENTGYGISGLITFFKYDF